MKLTPGETWALEECLSQAETQKQAELAFQISLPSGILDRVKPSTLTRPLTVRGSMLANYRPIPLNEKEVDELF